ncbi:hypothetical protein A1Q1_05294 [Trichosporon asahii var. asahii CBS 2479]|uniref:Synaptosomal-associated protein, 23kDa n=1 Tax=Trichosporon asahii var. asahii (strain ATCC 90039 / CBS 2479 / JCM 2466 / KCTC 7840 / NBRC 103889/ NCYC 2677 / UAMH 7654) TaxID=1186058 RepID=J5SKX5_TRIAS|nr:hypothetical protein A1Q1_05294 [Trichosporon asahii var. asahii CBS 2479]EJT46186.1 hypothetical protein A1Q1_05294 [Trichosporon asahii var. asahii CBS 2479]
MGFFKRKEALTIPPVEPSGGIPDRRPSPQPMRGGGRPDPYTSNSYGGGRNNGPPPQQGGYQPREHKDPYAAVQADRQMGSNPNNPYARKGVPSQADRDNDAARNELFGGMKPQGQGPSREGTPGAGWRSPPVGGGEIPAPRRREYGYQGRELEEDFDEDEEIEGIKQSMRETKQDSLQSTRNALRMAREAEETARGTMARLGDQSERLANSERHLDMAKANNQRAEDKAQELKVLNRSIFRPAIVFNKEGKRQSEGAEDPRASQHGAGGPRACDARRAGLAPPPGRGRERALIPGPVAACGPPPAAPAVPV